jgi:hypothetical protein
MVFWYGPVQSDKRLDRTVRSFQQSPKKATDQTGPDRGQSNRGAQVVRANQTPARWAGVEHQTETGITELNGSERAAPNWPANRRRPT